MDEGSASGASSGASSPEPQEPFTPKYTVRMTDRVTKDGDSVKFTLQVSQVGAKWLNLCKDLFLTFIIDIM